MNQRLFWKRYHWAIGDNPLLKIVGKALCRLTMWSEGSEIPFSNNINDFQMPHGLKGIFISRDAQIGTGCTIFQHVTIGSNTLPNTSKPGSPIVGNDCYIGAGAKIIGGIKVGDGVRVGANAVVVSTVENNSTVVMGSVRMIQHRERRDNSFITAMEASAEKGRHVQ